MSRSRVTDEQRAELFFMKVNKTPSCWNWTAYVHADGYGQFRDGYSRVMAHRFSYQLAYDAIPDGLVIDHLCRNRRCVNPDHLRAVTQGQNAQNRAATSQSNKSSGMRNVAWVSERSRWRVVVTSAGVAHYGGYYTDLDDAIEAASALRRAVHPGNLADRMVSA